MEKRTKIRHIAKVSGYFPGFAPITETSNYPMYMILKVRFENFTRWPETEQISRKEFEKELHNDEELVEAYLDVYSKKAVFYLCRVKFDELEYHYCIMCVEKQIVMLYYRKLLMIIEK